MDDKKKDWLFRVFLTISLVWTVGVSWFLFKDQVLYNGYSPMPLNEIGDFLAGSFSPLAFFWLAYGYFMQNSELKLNRKSLEKQIEEFEKSVATQRDALNFNKQQEELREERRMFLAQSKFTFSNLDYVESSDPSYANHDRPTEWVTLSLKVKNWGQKIFNVKFELFDHDNKLASHNTPSIEKNESLPIEFYGETIPHKTNLIISYTDSLSMAKQKKYFINTYCLPDSGPERITTNAWDQHLHYDVSCEEIIRDDQ